MAIGSCGAAILQCGWRTRESWSAVGEKRRSRCSEGSRNERQSLFQGCRQASQTSVPQVGLHSCPRAP